MTITECLTEKKKMGFTGKVEEAFFCPGPALAAIQNIRPDKSKSRNSYSYTSGGWKPDIRMP